MLDSTSAVPVDVILFACEVRDSLRKVQEHATKFRFDRAQAALSSARALVDAYAETHQDDEKRVDFCCTCAKKVGAHAELLHDFRTTFRNIG